MQPSNASGQPDCVRFNPLNSFHLLKSKLDSDLEYGDPAALGNGLSALEGCLRPAPCDYPASCWIELSALTQGPRRHHRIRSRGAGDARSRAVIVFLSKAWKTAMSQAPKYVRRPVAGQHIYDNFGFCSGKSLASLASRGLGPRYHRVGKNGPVVYEISELDRWALEQLSAPIQSPRDLVVVADAEATAA